MTVRKAKSPAEPRVSALAKIAPPAVASIYARTRLFRALDQARSHPVIWISAPGGSGKTTLIASYLQARRVPAVWYQMDAGDNDAASFFYYMGLAAKEAAPKQSAPLPLLTAEYLAGLPTFTVNYFRELFARLKPRSVIVLDNYHDVSADGVLQDILKHAFDQIPIGINIIVLSREEPPGAFARARACDRIALMGWETLKLTEAESAEIIKLRHKRARPSEAVVTALHRQTQGWIAGLVLLSEQPGDFSMETGVPGEVATQSIFDYFANELFQRTDASTQKFLLETSFLPKISVPVARSLTGETHCEAILRDLARRNYFTVKRAEGSYEYHPLFRQFLTSRASKVYTAAQIKQLKQRSAQLLTKNGDIETGVTLLQQAEDWAGAIQLIATHARALSAQGRTQTIETWLQAFPVNIRDKNPWVLYWLGACRLASSASEARRYFERAFALFEKQSDATPVYLAWSGIVDSFVLEWNDATPMGKWLDMYPTLAKNRTPAHPRVEEASVFTYLAGLLVGHSDHPNIAEYAARAEVLYKNETVPERWLARGPILVIHYMWSGEFAKAGALIENLAPHVMTPNARPLARLYWYIAKTSHAAHTGAPEESLRAVTDGLALAESSGIHLMDVQMLSYGIWGQFCAGNLATAHPLLERMRWLMNSDQSRVPGYYRMFFALEQLHEGNTARALEEARQCYDIAKSKGLFVGIMNSLLCLAAVYGRDGNTDAALDAIAQARAIGDRMQSKLFACYCNFSLANILRLRGELTGARKALQEALAAVEAMGIVTPGWCMRDDAAALYAMALEANIHHDYVRTIITKTRLTPPRDTLPERWPWQVRLYTLGRFAVVNDDKPLTFTGKAQKKPLELLRTLIAFGGRDVSAKKLAQSLWPEADGDMGEHNLETTIYRLRKLIGDKTIVLSGGQLSLNPEICWTDMWAVERLLDSGINGTPDPAKAARLFELYRGTFLEGDDAPHALLQRERLRAKFLRAVLMLGETIELKLDCAVAAGIYQQAVEIEPAAEELYVRLMKCYRRMKRPTEALAAYERCQATLKSLLHIEPTEEARTLRAQILQERA